jgi:hypothetical protein
MISRAHMRRQLRAKGGITDVVQRTNYLFGGIKDRIRKLIPNEIANVASKAAPFVAPFNPAAGALMRGIGRFDQRGSISDALKQGAATFAFGAGARKLGGAKDVFGGGLRDFSSPLSEERTKAIGSLFDKGEGGKEAAEKLAKDKSGILPKKVVEATTGKIPGVRALPKIVQEQLLAGGITAGASVLASYFQGDFREQEPGETMEDYLAARRETVGQQMRTYMDSYFKFDPEYSALDDAGRDMFVARYNVKDGGRIGYQTGGISSANTLAENIARNRAAQSSFQQSLAPTRENIRNQIASQSARSIAKNITASPKTTVGNYPKFLQMTPSNISQARSLTYPQAFALESQYKFDPKYVGADKTSRLGYFKQGLQSLAGIQQPGSNVGGATPLTRKLALDVGEKVLPTIAKGVTALTSLPASTALMTLNPTTANVDEANMTIEDFQNLYNSPEEQAAREADKARQAAETTPTPDAGTNLQAGVIPGFTRLKNPNSFPGNYDEFMYKGPDGDIYGSETYGRMAASGSYKDLFKDYYNKPTMADVAGPSQEMMEFTGESFANVPISILNLLRTIPASDYNSMGPRRQEVEKIIQERTGKTAADFLSLKSGGRVGLMGGAMPTGIMRSNKAGVMERDYRDKGGFVPVGIKEKADDVPAMLSKNEFVMTANAVRGAGNGSIEKGAQRMYDTMKKLEKRAV